MKKRRYGFVEVHGSGFPLKTSDPYLREGFAEIEEKAPYLVPAAVKSEMAAIQDALGV